MDPRVKHKWTAALTSGEYMQGRGAMRSTTERYDRPVYCCLGVLCDLYDKERPAEVIWSRFNSLMTEILPDAVSEWAGLNPCNSPRLQHNGLDAKMSVLNDNRKLSFAEIADLIKQQL